MRCNKMAVAGAVAVALMAGKVQAFLDTGTLLTNAASATYSAGGQASSISYSATAKILVANPALFLWKDIAGPTCVTASAGGTIVFSICFSNGGANSAFNVTIKDRLPEATYWIGVSTYSSWWIDLAGTGQTLTTYYGQAIAGPNWYKMNDPSYVPYQMLKVASCPFLMWVVPNLGVGKSGCVQFMVSVH